jgi:glutamyl-tRNA synthetase
VHSVRTRFAPSPTGDLHLGGAWTALASWVLARRASGRSVLRVEDLDAPRVRAGSAARIAEDLRWLGLDWDEGPDVGGMRAPYTQSARSALYQAAVDELARKGLVYACDCSRKEIAEAASAPHGEVGAAGDARPGAVGAETRYPGTCRDKSPSRAFRRDPALRLRVPADAEVAFVDAIHGPVRERVAEVAGDFVLRRGDGLFAYQLAVSVDDWAMGITDVVRGADLLASTARQQLLLLLLGVPERSLPRNWHVPLVVAPGGARLQKRDAPTSIRALAARGVSAESIVGALAQGLGIAPDAAPRSPRALLQITHIAWRTTPWETPAAWA